MLLIKAVTAYMAIGTMMEQELDYETAHALVVLREKLRPHAEFFTREELRLAKEYGKKNAKGEIDYDADGRFTLESPEAAEKYTEERKKLGAVELQEEIKPLHAPRPERIKPSVLEALDGLIEFGGDA